MHRRQLVNRACQLYKNIGLSMLFLFRVKDGKLSTGVIAIFNQSINHVYLSTQTQYNKINSKKQNCVNWTVRLK